MIQLYIKEMQYLTICDLPKIQVRLNLMRIIDQNSILKNEIIQHSLNEVHFTLDLFSNGSSLGHKETSNFFVLKNLFDQSIIFNCNYEDLSIDSRISIAIWSSAKKYHPNHPLGSTVISIFSQTGELRQGKYHLFIWPNVLPDLQQPSTTPGLTNDPNIQTLNFISSKLQQIQKVQELKKSAQALMFKQSYTSRLIPAAFLQVEFPKFSVPIYFTDKISEDYEQPDALTGNLLQVNQSILLYDPDSDNGLLNPLEEFFYSLKRQNVGHQQKLIPTREQIKLIDAITNRTFRIDLKPAEKQLFSTYRYFLSQDKKYLCHYLNSINWNSDQDSQIQRLLRQWQKIDQADALYLLSREFSINPLYSKRKQSSPRTMKIIRDYAVSVIYDMKDQDLISILLFLIQSLRYDGQGHFKSNLFQFLVSRCRQQQQISTLMYWYLKAESQTVIGIKDSKHVKDIAQQNNRIYSKRFNQFMSQIIEDPILLKLLDQQSNFIKLLRGISKVIKQMKDINQKKQQLRKRLGQVNWQQFGLVSFPLDVSIVLKAPIIAECTIFNSAMAPFKLTFSTTSGSIFSFIYKSGDDLRQDQLILEMFSLMDRLLKGVNQDYKLTPYKALSCSKSDGYVEFVPETKTFQSIKNLKEYLQNLVKEKPGAMENYVFSCAGYCAITYFFGIGDRHLQNLLIDSTGKMFHIDFGFILGRDPKPYPPPIKIRKDMIQAMGGTQSQNFKIFKTKCLQAFLYLRKYNKLVYNLVYLMIDSGIKDVHMQGMSKLYDKFSINMNDKQAEKHFLMVLQQCKNAIFAIINDKFHKWAEHFK